MNNLFSLHRFAILLRKDLMQALRNSFNTFLVLESLYVFVSLFSIFISYAINPVERVSFFFFFFLLFVIMLPRLVYGNVNDKKGGIEYGMLPVSFVEKFISMILTVGVVMPALFVASVFVIDILLVLVSPSSSGAVGYIWDDIYGLDLNSVMTTVFSFFLVQTPFLLGNLYLKGHKVTKTSFILIALHLVLILILVQVGIRYAISIPYLVETEEQFLELANEQEGYMAWFVALYTYVTPCVLLLLSLLKIKRLQYK